MSIAAPVGAGSSSAAALISTAASVAATVDSRGLMDSNSPTENDSVFGISGASSSTSAVVSTTGFGGIVNDASTSPNLTLSRSVTVTAFPYAIRVPFTNVPLVEPVSASI